MQTANSAAAQPAEKRPRKGSSAAKKLKAQKTAETRVRNAEAKRAAAEEQRERHLKSVREYEERCARMYQEPTAKDMLCILARIVHGLSASMPDPFFDPLAVALSKVYGTVSDLVHSEAVEAPALRPQIKEMFDQLIENISDTRDDYASFEYALETSGLGDNRCTSPAYVPAM